MGEITLHPGRIGVRSYDEEETIWPGTVAELGPYFFHGLRITPEFTLGDLFALLDRDDADLLEFALGEDVLPVLEDARLEGAGGEDVRLEYLTVTNVHEHGCLRREFHGWGPWDELYDGAWEEDPECPRWGAIAVGLTPVRQLLDVPLRYDPSVTFLAPRDVDSFRTEVDISLIEFLKAIFYELTFYGPPDQRDELREDLRRRVEQIERGLDEK
jgi:hypothetical protein